MEKSIVSKAEEKLDQEWIALVLAALESGISPQEIKDFFHQRRK